MLNLPFGTGSPQLVEEQFASLWLRLERLLGRQGVEAVMEKALKVASGQWTQLELVTLRQEGLDFSAFLSASPVLGDDVSQGEASVALQCFADCVRFLLTDLLGPDLAVELVAPAKGGSQGPLSGPLQG